MEEALRARLVSTAAVTALVQAKSIVWGKRIGLPAVALFLVAGRPDYHLKGRSGLASSVVQVDCWASSYVAARNLAAAVRQALDGATADPLRGLSIEAERSTSETGDGAPGATGPSDFYRVSLDVRVWHTQP